GPERGARGDEEHDDDLILHRLERGDSGEELSGHHPREAREADGDHAVQDGNHPGADRSANGVARLPIAWPPTRAAFPPWSSSREALPQAVETERDAVMASRCDQREVIELR